MLNSVAIVLLEEMLTSSISLPVEMLYSAQNIAKLEGVQQTQMNMHTVCLEQRTVHTQAGLTLLADKPFHEVPAPSLILLPTFWRNPLRGINRTATLIPWLQQAAAAGSQICTVSTGSFLLAEAGLLDNRAATTHWYYLDLFQKRYPLVQVQRHHLITQADNLHCAGSINSVADLMVYFISRYFGDSVARQVESQFSPEIRRTHRESLYIEGDSDLHHDETVAAIQVAINTNSHLPLSMQRLAEQHNISARTLNRRFKTITGHTPLQYLQQKRIHSAQELLLKTDMSVAEVAAAVGYEDSSYFIELFKRTVQITPQNYRNSVRRKLFSTR